MNQNLLNPKKILAFLSFSVGFSCLSYSQAIIRDTLFYTGGEQNYIVPCGVTNLTIDAFGAKGANGISGGNNSIGGVGGLGGHAQGNLTVSNGQTLSVFVGGQANGGLGGYNGGAIGGGAGPTITGGGGGGATDVRLGGNTIDNRILVAGGGGGGGAIGCQSPNANGGNGGAGGGGNGSNGNNATEGSLSAGGGSGAVGVIGGAFGVGCNGFYGLVGGDAVGELGGNGGNAPSCCCFSFFSIPGGGGGGGGYLGGGGGGGGTAGDVNCSIDSKGAGGGGAGGTNFVSIEFSNPITINGVNNGNGYVVFSYENPIPSTPETTSFTTSICASSTVPYEVTPILNATAYTWTVTGDLTIVSGQGTDSITVTSTGNNGTISVVAENSCGVSDQSVPITVTINQNPVLTITAGDFSVCLGEEVTLEATGADTYVWTSGVENATPFTPTTSATYSVIGSITATSCSAELSQAVTVNPVPNPTITSSLPSPFCAGENVTLTGNPAGGTFSVTTGDAGALVGNVFNAATQGSWVIEYNVTNAEGCFGSETINLSTNCTVGLSQLSLESELTIYPNPTTGQFKITSELNGSGELQLFNQAGQLVYKKSLENLKENNIDIKNLTPGYYNIQVISNSKKYLGKLNVINLF